MILQCSDIYDLQVLKLMYAYIMQNDLPLPLFEQFTRNTEIHGHNTRQNLNLLYLTTIVSPLCYGLSKY